MAAKMKLAAWFSLVGWIGGSIGAFVNLPWWVAVIFSSVLGFVVVSVFRAAKRGEI
jgi:hypothetical protein